MYDYRYATGVVFSMLAIAAGAIMYQTVDAQGRPTLVREEVASR
jgi:hypothetical protein